MPKATTTVRAKAPVPPPPPPVAPPKATPKPKPSSKAAAPAPTAPPVKGKRIALTTPEPAAQPGTRNMVGPAEKLTLSLALVADIVRKMLPADAPGAEIAAADYWGASMTASYAEKWRERAKKSAIAAGALPNRMFDIGTQETVFAGSFVTVDLRVNPQADRVDMPGLIADLLAAGVADKVVTRLVAKNTKSFPGAHVYTATLT